MTRKIFSSILSVSVIVLLLCLISISGILYGYFGNVIKKELRTEADIMAQQIEDDDTYLQNMNAIDNRVTLVVPTARCCSIHRRIRLIWRITMADRKSRKRGLTVIRQ